jgi:biopolymer transport protein ExbD
MKPEINVTPLIDILLVLLIIFMVVAPLKPARFETKIPAAPERTQQKPKIHPNTLIVGINKDSTLALNAEKDLGTIAHPGKLSARLREIFAARLENRVFGENRPAAGNLSPGDGVEKTVFIKAPKSLAYGEVVKVIDEIKTVGADPVSLQIDDLEN